MAALTEDQIELIQRARVGLPVWGGSVAIDRLRRDVELLLRLGIIQLGEDGSYLLTHLGLRAHYALGRPD